MSELIEKVIKIAQGIYIQGGEKRTHELAQEIIDLVEQYNDINKGKYADKKVKE